MQDLVNNDGFYRVRVKADPAAEDSPYVVSVIQACQLLVSNFEEVFTVHLDKKGSLVGLEFQTSYGHQPCMGNAEVTGDSGGSASSFSMLLCRCPLRWI